MRLANDVRELTSIETRRDGRDVPRLVAEIMCLSEFLDSARRMHEARLQYERALTELKVLEREKAETEEEFSRVVQSLCL